MNKIINIYNESIESEYDKNSTELTDEHIQTESFGKWVKHLVTKRKKSQRKRIKENNFNCFT